MTIKIVHAAIFTLFLVSLILVSGCEKPEFNLVPKGTTGGAIETDNTEVGTGYSTQIIPEKAVQEAINMALEGKKNKNPDIAIVFASSGSDMQAILDEIKKLLGDVKIYGGTSDSRAVVTEKGFVKATERGYEHSQEEEKRALAIMTVSSKEIVFGTGATNLLEYSSAQEASKAAVLEAMKNAGKSQNEKPNLVLLTPTIGVEEEIIEGIEMVLGKDMIILGGTAGGPNAAVFGKDKIYEKGVSLAVIYTNLPIGWVYEGGFDVTDPYSGIATKVEGQNIIEIDNKPALDVYNEWLGGKIDSLYREIKDSGKIRDLLTLHPLYRKYTNPSGQDYFLFSHPWPKDDSLKERIVGTSTKIKAGEKIYLSHGTWEILLNRIGNLPTKAKLKGNIDIGEKPVLSIGYICAGVMGAIPEAEREKIPILIGYANNNAPFIASFTWGEEGQFPGIGNKHGNLLTSFIVIGR